MTNTSIHFRCPGCRVKIKASLQLAGRRFECPRCRRGLAVPRPLAPSGGAVLMLLETEDRFALRVAQRQPA